jgi:isopenicillin N synthase-like dioxygenase
MICPSYPEGKGTSDREIARRMVQAWRTDGIFQVATNAIADEKTENAFAANRRFFRMPFGLKSRCVSDLTYSGYIASGVEQTAGEADYSEIFTICPDVPADDKRVQARWPCHGPAPWPDAEYQKSMKTYMDELGRLGENS